MRLGEVAELFDEAGIPSERFKGDPAGGRGFGSFDDVMGLFGMPRAKREPYDADGFYREMMNAYDADVSVGSDPRAVTSLMIASIVTVIQGVYEGRIKAGDFEDDGICQIWVDAAMGRHERLYKEKEPVAE